MSRMGQYVQEQQANNHDHQDYDPGYLAWIEDQVKKDLEEIDNDHEYTEAF